MNYEAIHGAIDSAGHYAYTAVAEVVGNPQFKETVTTLCDFLNTNYELVFGFTVTFQILSAPLLFTTGMALGYWCYDKEITVMPGNLKWQFSSLFESSTAKLGSLALALLLRIVLAAAISAMAVGFLAGCAVRRMLLAAIAAGPGAGAGGPHVAAGH